MASDGSSQNWPGPWCRWTRPPPVERWRRKHADAWCIAGTSCDFARIGRLATPILPGCFFP